MIKKIVSFSLLFSSLIVEAEEEPPPPPPFYIEGEYFKIANASFKERNHRNEHLSYSSGQVRFLYNQPMNCYWGLLFGSGYDTVTLDWKENPFFDDKQFNYVNFGLGAYSSAFWDFMWSATVTAYIDTKSLDFSDYALYETILLGTHEVRDDLTFQVGFILLSGLNKEKIWPVFGFEWDNGGKVRIGAVFPLDLAIEYRILENLSIAAAGRFIYTRHRVKESEPIPRSIFQYTNSGIEGEVIYFPFENLVFRGFLGSTFQGDLKIANAKNHDATHFKQKSALYGGSSLTWLF